jgi:hypothetical protein
MSDLFKTGDLSPGSSTGITTPGLPSGGQGNPDTGDLRRKYNFGDRVSELSIAQDPFFRFLSKVSKKPTDDPNFKFTEKRHSFHKRYAYVTAHGSTVAVSTANNATVTASNIEVDDVYFFKMEADYKNSGNITSVYGNANNQVAVGAAGTLPGFFMKNQVVKINFNSTSPSLTSSAANDYILIRVMSTTVSGQAQILEGKVVKTLNTATNNELCSFKDATTTISGVALNDLADSSSAALEPKKCYVVGNAHEEGSGYPETWKDQPYSTSYGQTQIWKTAMAMTNTARATALRYDSNEWARVWKEKLIEHKWDMEQSLLFGSQQSKDGINYTQGAVDWILNKANIFSGFDISTYTADDFLDDMSAYMDPRYGGGGSTVFFCSTAVYNWLHKLGGYFKNNLEISANFRADMAITGKKKVFGVDITTITTPYGDMNVARNIHLDGTDISILAIDMKHAAYRPLVGNGLNRDTSVYVGVQTLENSGIDRRVDLILTEAGMEWQMPEAHAIWKS